MLITILGKRWGFRRQHKLSLEGKRVDGYCDPPTKTGKEIVVEERLSEERELQVIIHECLHAAAWHLDEQLVTQFGDDVGRFLIKLGYRRN